MHDTSTYAQYLGCIFISIDLSQSQITLPAKDQSVEAILLSDNESNVAFSFIDNKIAETDVFGKELAKANVTDNQTLLTRTENYLIYSIGIPESSLSLLYIINRCTQEYATFYSMLFLILITSQSQYRSPP